MAVKIYICSDADFDCPVKGKDYKIMDVGSMKVDLPLDAHFYGGFAAFKKVASFRNLPKYVGFCQNRRYFEFMDDIPDTDKLFEEYDCVAGKPVGFRVSMEAQYARSHNVEDLDIVKEIVRNDYPEYYDSLKEMLRGNHLYANGMFIMRRDDFRRLTDYLFGVLDRYLEMVGTDIEGRVNANKGKYIKNNGIGNTVEYQTRIGAYLCERLTSAFIMQLGKVKEYPVKEIK